MSDFFSGGAEKIRLPNRITDWSKLRIENGVIHYRLYQQDGSERAMTCADNVENRNFVSWVQMHDRNVGFHIDKPALS